MVFKQSERSAQMWRRLRNIHVLLLVRAYEDSPVSLAMTHTRASWLSDTSPSHVSVFPCLVLPSLGSVWNSNKVASCQRDAVLFLSVLQSLGTVLSFFRCALCLSPVSCFRSPPLACAFLFYLWPSVAALFITRFPRFFAFSLRLLGRSYRVVFN